MSSTPLAAMALFLIGCQSSPGPRPDPLAPPASRPTSPQDPEDPESAEPPNHLGLFLGASHKKSHDGFTFGIEYKRDISELVRLGVVLESTPSLDERVVAAPAVFLRPLGALEVGVGAGVQIEEGDPKFMVRVGVAWEFDLGGNFGLGPEVSLDFVSGGEDILVYGLVLAYAF